MADARMLSLHAVDGAAHGVLVYACVRDHRGRIAALRRRLDNPAARRLLAEPRLAEALDRALPERATADLFERYVACASAGRAFRFDKAVQDADGEVLLGIEVDVQPCEGGLVLHLRDVGDRLAETARWQRRAARLQVLARRARDVVLLLDDTGHVRWAGGRVDEVLGCPAEDLVGRPVAAALHPDDRARIGPRPTPGRTVRGRARDGRRRLEVLLDTDEEGPVAVLRDITAVHALEQRLAEVDPDGALPGLVPRRPFLRQLAQEVGRRQRYGRPATVVALALDGQAELARTHGEAAVRDAQRVLVEAAGQILRTSDVLGRWSDQVYVLLLPETPEAGALRAAERLAECLAAAGLSTEAGPVPLSLCAGVTALDATDDPKRALARAGRILAAARRAGPGRVQAERIDRAA